MKTGFTTTGLKRQITLWAGGFLFILALSLRLLYQSESQIDNPLRADAFDYFRVAYNMHFYGIYSSGVPEKKGVAPVPDFRRSPGYPLLLYPFIAWNKSVPGFISAVSLFQAVLGSLTAVLAFILARMMLLPWGWALAAGVLTALSPHLIAVDHFLLTESSFTFVLVLTVLVFGVGLRNNRWTWLFVSGLLSGYLVLIRPAAMLLGPVLAAGVCFLGGRFDFRRQACIGAGLLFTGYILVNGSYVLIRNAGHTGQAKVSGESTWAHFMGGADIGLVDIMRYQKTMGGEQEWQAIVNDPQRSRAFLRERLLKDPLSAISWYVGGKPFFVWRWDNLYNGDVYQYPMLRKGFEENPLLRVVHRGMKAMHWPLYFLSLCAPLIVVLAWRRKASDPGLTVLATTCLAFLSFLGLFILLMPMERYAIPLKPLAFVMAVFTLYQMVVTLGGEMPSRRKESV